jgi:hypothetical protein
MKLNEQIIILISFAIFDKKNLLEIWNYFVYCAISAQMATIGMCSRTTDYTAMARVAQK